MNGHAIPFINFHYPYFSSGDKEEDGYFTLLDLAFFPLINAIERLENDGIKYAISISLSASFTQLLENKKINKRYCERNKSLQAEENRQERRDALRDILFWMNQYQGEPLLALRRLAAYGHLEIITGTATNAPLPLLAPVPEAVKTQISIALEIHKHFFEHECHGICLSQSCWYSELPEILKETGIEYAVVAPAPSSRQMDMEQPMLINSSFGVLLAHHSLSDVFNESLAGEWQKANDSANAMMGALQSAIIPNAKENAVENPVFLLFADALSLLGENRTKKMNALFLELLLRKISCDQDEVLLETPASYLATTKEFIDCSDIDALPPNLTQYYQAGYQQLFPDLHIAALKLLKFGHDASMVSVRAKMVRELILAQSGDHCPHEDHYCRDHLQKFIALIERPEELISKEYAIDAIDENGDEFASSIDLSKFY